MQQNSTLDRFRRGLVRRAIGLAAWGRYWAATHIFQQDEISCGRLRLPLSGDGDWQEIGYLVYGAEWYDNERHFFLPLLKPGDHIIDVGANLGFLSAIFAEIVGPEGRVYCFEPARKSFAKLTRTIALNGLQNCIAIPNGCGSEHGIACLNTSSASSGNFSLQKSESGKFDEIRLVPLDDTDAATSHVALVKIDVEGSEPDVLRGAARLLARDKPLVFIEMGSDHPEASMEAARFLSDLGYGIVFPAGMNERAIDWRVLSGADNYLWRCI